MKPDISVLMPIYRTPSPLLREAVQSILDQTFGDFELILVEDPSEATAGRLVGEFNDARIRYVLNERRTGLVNQRNHALQLAGGRYLVKADSDDVSEPNRLEHQRDFLESNPSVGLVGSFLTIINAQGEPIGQRTYPVDHQHIRATITRRNPIAQPAACFRRELYDRFGGYPRGYPVCQDYAYWSHLAKCGVRFANLPEYLVRYRQHEASIKSRRLKETLEATIRIKETYWADELSLADRMRILGERGLKLLPAGWTQTLFKRLTYRRRSG
ncbi:MAG: glycosyltransferase [Pirellulales bacterium]|nr:glycosyltransferase [Pirellulales bacterium]